MLMFYGLMLALAARVPTGATVAGPLTSWEISPLLDLAAPMQAAAVSGRVVNEKGEALPGATVKVAGKVMITNENGDFVLTAPTANQVLVVAYLGYQTQTIMMQSLGPITIVLHPVVANASASLASATLVDEAGTKEVNTLVAFADELPTFPGGGDAYRVYLSQNALYPAEAKAKGLAGVVYVRFVVDEVGRILDAEVLKGCGNGFDEEALRLVRLMPWWRPGRLAGKVVRVPCSLRIKFEMKEGAE